VGGKDSSFSEEKEAKRLFPVGGSRSLLPSQPGWEREPGSHYKKSFLLWPLENPAVRDKLASGGQRLCLCTPLGPAAPDPDLLLGYSRSFTHCKDGPGAARPWWVQGEALAAGGDLPDFQAIRVLLLFLQKRRILPYFLNRLAFALARLWNGRKTASASLPCINAVADACVACSFSVSIRWYSAGVHSPVIINPVRCQIVSSEAEVSSAIIIGNRKKSSTWT
jgi:hypothetical protein